ncbi:hypothetical protein LP420_12970 [Massilia sp. B-10]|nr:hypothetical protein LP420_12970 [Massilia sp. B-10]UUZ57571.1 hypothetical protein LP419_12385 [Massilia sp. H-1]
MRRLNALIVLLALLLVSCARPATTHHTTGRVFGTVVEVSIYGGTP